MMINILGLTLTIIVYIIVLRLKKYRLFKKTPIIIFVGFITIFLIKLFNIDYQYYNKSASILTFLLGPATIALAYPLYSNRHVLLTNKRAVWIGLFAATIIAIISTFIVGSILHTDLNVTMSMIPKSVTTPIAVEISKTIGGIPELTACIVILTGLIGGLSGHRLLHACKIKNDVAIGLSIGAASHVLGTTRCYEKNKPKQVAISTLALIIVGLLTAIIAPILLNIFIK